MTIKEFLITVLGPFVVFAGWLLVIAMFFVGTGLLMWGVGSLFG